MAWSAGQQSKQSQQYVKKVGPFCSFSPAHQTALGPRLDAQLVSIQSSTIEAPPTLTFAGKVSTVLTTGCRKSGAHPVCC